MIKMSKITKRLLVFVLLGAILLLIVCYLPVDKPSTYRITDHPNIKLKYGTIFRQNIKYIQFSTATKKLKKGKNFATKIENASNPEIDNKLTLGVKFGTKIKNSATSSSRFVDENPFETIQNVDKGSLGSRNSIENNALLSQFMVNESSQHANYKVDNQKSNSIPSSSMRTFISNNNTSNNSNNQPIGFHTFSIDLRSLQTMLSSKEENLSFGPDPGDPGDTGDDLGEPVAPVPDGFWFLLLLGVLYAGWKTYKKFRLKKV
jgi:hypothetical protein